MVSSALRIIYAILNVKHIVTDIVDKDSYKVELPLFNLLSTRTDTKGGVVGAGV